MPTMKSRTSGPSFQRRTKGTNPTSASTSGVGSVGKTTQFDGRAMAKKLMQKTKKSANSARITANVTGTGKTVAKGY